MFTLRFVYYCTMYALVSQFWSAQFEQNVAGANEKRICFSDNFPCVYTRSFFLIIVLLWGGNFLLAGFKNSCLLRSSKEMRSIFNVESCALQLQINFRHYIIEVNQYSLHVHQRRRRNLSKTAISSWKRIKCYPCSLRRRNLKTAKLIGHFRFVF